VATVFEDRRRPDGRGARLRAPDERPWSLDVTDRRIVDMRRAVELRAVISAPPRNAANMVTWVTSLVNDMAWIEDARGERRSRRTCASSDVRFRRGSSQHIAALARHVNVRVGFGSKLVGSERAVYSYAP